MRRHVTAWLGILALLIAPAGPAVAGGPKPMKSEVERATGKCVGSVLAGALLGALVGRALDRHGAATGAALGATAGAGVCAVLIANARHRDSIYAAQRAAVMAGPNQPQVQTWADDNGQQVSFAATASADQQLDGARLIPVKYTSDNVEHVSPAFEANTAPICRTASGTFNGTQAAPSQLYCRTAAGDWEPYGMKKS